MDLIIALFLLPLTVVTGFFAIEVIAGLRRLREEAAGYAGTNAIIIVPANNEERVIGRTLAELREAAEGVARILVVADNCTDATLQVARLAGAEVIERADPERRGKGFALAFARDHLAGDPPDVVVVADADCRLDADSLRQLIAIAHRSGRPVQAVNLLRPATGGTPLVRISTFAFLIKNLVRQRGLQRLAGRVHLTGTGMALPWPLFAGAALATSNIVEDLLLGLDLAKAGRPAQLAPSAQVWSAPGDARDTLVQRSRWEGGYLATARSLAPRAFADALRRGSVRDVAAALDLCVPPLALLVIANAIGFAIAALVTLLLSAPNWPLIAHLVVLAVAGLAVIAAWLREGREFVRLRDLAIAPLYVAWKLPLYLRLARGAPSSWLRARR